MKVIVSLLLAAFVGVASALSKNAYKVPQSLTLQTLPDLPTTNIVGGTIAPQGRYSYIAAVFFSTSSSATPGCGGTLIAPNVVLTAAHCQGSVRVRMGCYTISSGCPETFTISQEVVNPNYNGDLYSNDFSVLILSGSSSFAPIPYVADSSYANSLVSGDDLTVMGWGTTSSGGSLSNTLREVVVDYMTNAECAAKYDLDTPGLILSSMMCAARSGKDSCQGDSGGPLIIKCDATKTDLLVGDVSWGFGCADSRFPGVYGRLSTAQSFLTSVLSPRGITLATPPPISSVCSGATVPPSPTSPPVASPTIPPSWTCTASWYNALDGCDCECGAPDPDCDVAGQTLYRCDGVCVQGVCVTGTTPPTPFPNTPPTSWTCPSSYYNSLDGCDCATCGDVDPDCLTSGQTLYGCGSTATGCNVDTNTCITSTGRRLTNENLRATAAEKMAAKMAAAPRK